MRTSQALPCLVFIIKREYTNTNVGGVSITRATATQSKALPPIGPSTLSIMRVAGILPQAPLVNW